MNELLSYCESAEQLPDITEVDWDTAHVENTGGYVMIWYCRTQSDVGEHWFGYAYGDDTGAFVPALDDGEMDYDADEHHLFYYEDFGEEVPEIYEQMKSKAQEMYEVF